jgi:hypothetical protein
MERLAYSLCCGTTTCARSVLLCCAAPVLCSLCALCAPGQCAQQRHRAAWSADILYCQQGVLQQQTMLRRHGLPWWVMAWRMAHGEISISIMESVNNERVRSVAGST